MRTLKKSLCLVLAVVMMFSLCAIGASAAETSFTDDDEITYNQAVQILSELGVITGYEDGSFQPEGTLTRAEACAIIVRLLNMENATGVSTFTDTQGHWAENYIAYCVGAGIVAGYGDGTFGPDDTLTGYAWEKMVICALGYDADYESMTGVNWTIGVATLAKKMNLEKGLATVAMNNDVSRDVAAKLAYNGMLKSVVTFHSNISTVTSGDVSVSINSGAYYTNYDGTDVDAYDGSNILEVYWNATVTKGETDDFGRPSTNYAIAELNFDVTVPEDPIAIVSARTNAASFATLLSGYKVFDNSRDTSGTNWSGTVNINNSTKYTDDETTDEVETNFTVANGIFENGERTGRTVSIPSDKDTLCEALQELTDNGKVIEFYATDDDNPLVLTDIAIIEYTVGKVSKVSTSGSVTTYSVKPINDSGSSSDSSNKVVDSNDHSADTAILASDVAKDDIVTYVVANSNLYIYPTTEVEGYFSAFTTSNHANSVTVDGTRYSVAMGVSDGVNYLATNTSNSTVARSDLRATDSDVTLYLDQFGYAVYTDGTSASDYVFVLGVGDSGTVLDENSREIGIIDQEGTTSIVYWDVESSSGETPEQYQWYTLSANGSYKYFNAPDGSTYAEVDGTIPSSGLKSSQPTLDTAGDIIANGSTVFIIKTKGSYKIYTGVGKLPTYTGAAGEPVYAVVEIDDDGSYGYAVAVYVDVGDTSSSSSDDEVIYLLKSGENYTGNGYDSNGTEYFTYDAIVDGAKTTITASTKISGTPGLYTYDTDSDGYVSGVTAVNYADVDDYTTTYEYGSQSMSDGAKISYSSPVLTVDGVAYTMDDEAVVYYIHGNSNTTDIGDASLLVGTLDASNGATVHVVYKSSSNHTVTELYFKTTGSIDD